MNRNDAPWGRDLQEYLDLLGFDAPIIEQQGSPLAVWGQGNPHAELVFVLEALEGIEQEQAAHLLLKMIQAMGYSLESAYILYFAASTEEVFQHLKTQVPNSKVIVALGDQAACLVFGSNETLSELRSKKLNRSFGRTEAALFATHHPGELLTRAEQKKEAWEDLKAVIAHLS
ncbi:MAG: hypothetical protein R3A80_09415 [Bdellovibrionota bacterium]